MATDLQLTDELDAVNSMLALIGETPLNSIATPGTVTGITAKATLRRTSRTVQTKGWYWNKELDWPLALSVPDGYLYVPAETLKVAPSPDYWGREVVQRDNYRLYDRLNRTFVFDEPMNVDLTLFLPLESIPQAAREYITIRAGRAFAASYIGDVDVVGFTERDMFDAWGTLMEAEDDSEVLNVLTQNWSTARVLAR